MALKAAAYPLSLKYFIRETGRKAQLLPPPLPLHLLLCTVLTYHADRSLTGLISSLNREYKDSNVQNPTKGGITRCSPKIHVWPCSCFASDFGLFFSVYLHLVSQSGSINIAEVILFRVYRIIKQKRRLSTSIQTFTLRLTFTLDLAAILAKFLSNFYPSLLMLLVHAFFITVTSLFLLRTKSYRLFIL